MPPLRVPPPPGPATGVPSAPAAPAAHPPGASAQDEADLRHRALRSLDAVLAAFRLEPLGDGRFRAPSEPGRRFAHVFGGQVVAQALLAAGATVPAGPEGAPHPPHSLHAYFVAAGTPGEPVGLEVDRVRDGRSVSTRQVTASQDGRPILTAIASFHTNPATPRLGAPAPPVPAPGRLPTLQDWARSLPPELHARARNWVEEPPPVEMRIGEPPSFLDGHSGTGPRSHWVRPPRPVGDDPLAHAALVAYVSDYLLLDMVLRGHPDRAGLTEFAGASLDHAIWFHRPPRFDGWHLHTQEALAVSGHRGLVRGTVHDEAGHLLATVMQEALIRPR